MNSNTPKALIRGFIRQPDGRDPNTLYYTIAQVAAMRGCNRDAVYNAVITGRLPAWVMGGRPGGFYLIPRAEAESWANRSPAINTAGREVKATERRRRRLEKAAARAAYERGKVLAPARSIPEGAFR